MADHSIHVNPIFSIGMPGAPARFLKRLQGPTANNCWIWTAATSGGYGRFIWMGKSHLSHRLAFAWAKGEFPASLDVLHECDNPPCCNPAHLFLGTAADNIADCIAKGRWPDRKNTANRRDGCRLSKVTQAQADTIKTDKRLLRVVAAEYGISISLVSAIRTGRKW